jgi:hypothetical protein
VTFPLTWEHNLLALAFMAGGPNIEDVPPDDIGVRDMLGVAGTSALDYSNFVLRCSRLGDIDQGRGTNFWGRIIFIGY